MRNSGQKSMERYIVVHWEGLFESQYYSTGNSKTNTVFILNTLFPQEVPYVNLTNSYSMVRLHFLNLWLLKAILNCVTDGVTTVKPHHTKGNAWMGADESSLLFPTSGRGYFREAHKLTIRNAWFEQWEMGEVPWWCGKHGILLSSLIPAMAKLLQGSMWTVRLGNQVQPLIQMYFWRVQFFKTKSSPIHTAQKRTKWTLPFFLPCTITFVHH
jgi:hypothetical protein